MPGPEFNPADEYEPTKEEFEQGMWELAVDRVLGDIHTERQKQQQKWGEQNHDGYRWLAILGEEVGEANQAMLQAEFGGKEAADLRKELIQVAAVAVAFVECIDRHSGYLFPNGAIPNGYHGGKEVSDVPDCCGYDWRKLHSGLPGKDGKSTHRKGCVNAI